MITEENIPIEKKIIDEVMDQLLNRTQPFLAKKFSRQNRRMQLTPRYFDLLIYLLSFGEVYLHI